VAFYQRWLGSEGVFECSIHCQPGTSELRHSAGARAARTRRMGRGRFAPRRRGEAAGFSAPGGCSSSRARATRLLETDVRKERQGG